MSEPEPDFGLLADKAWTEIRKDYFDEKSGLFRESYQAGKAPDHAAFNWAVGVVIPAMTSLMEPLEERSIGRMTELLEYVQASRVYWNAKGPVPGYDVLPGPKAVDRYYDDNEWMFFGLYRAYELTGDKDSLVWSKGALDFALSGEDDKLGGGIYWRESDKASKNTCSNSPAATACLEFYRATGDKKYRDAGLRILDWVMGHLYDKRDNLMWDSESLSGKIGKDKWSYNAALTVRALALAENEGVRKYPCTARQMFEAAWGKWSDPDGGMSGPGKFSHLLFEAGIKCGFLTQEQVKSVAKRVWELRAEGGGHWGESLDKPAKGPKYELIDEASAVRVLGLAAEYLRKDKLTSR